MAVFILLPLALLISDDPSESTLRERFLQEFPSASARNREFYSRLRGSATISGYVHPASTLEASRDPAKFAALRAEFSQMEGKLVRSDTVTFAIDGPLAKAVSEPAFRPPPKSTPDGESKDDPASSSGGGASRGNAEPKVAVCVGDASSFRVRWPAGGGPPVLSSFQVGGAAGDVQRYDQMVGMYIKCTYRPWNLSDRYFFPEPSFVVGRVIPVVKDGLSLAHVEFEIRYAKGEMEQYKDTRYAAGWFEARPDQNWIIQEWVASSAKIQEATHIKIEFGGGRDGLPLPKRISRSAPLGRHVIVFDSIDHAATPAREFTLAAFGLPEIDRKPEPPSRNRTAYVLIGAGILVLVAAIGLKVYTRPRQAAGRPAPG